MLALECVKWMMNSPQIACCLFVQNRELQIMRKLEHQNIVKLKFFFYSSGEKVRHFVSISLSCPPSTLPDELMLNVLRCHLTY